MHRAVLRGLGLADRREFQGLDDDHLADRGKLHGRAYLVAEAVLHKTETWLLADCRGLGEVRRDPGPAVGLERIVQLESGARWSTTEWTSPEADPERLATVREND
jgi:hypothetical protein